MLRLKLNQVSKRRHWHCDNLAPVQVRSPCLKWVIWSHQSTINVWHHNTKHFSITWIFYLLYRTLNSTYDGKFCSIELWSTTMPRLGIRKGNPTCSADSKYNLKYNQSEFVAYEASRQLCAWPKVKYNLQSANYVHDIAMNCVDMVFAICYTIWHVHIRLDIAFREEHC